MPDPDNVDTSIPLSWIVIFLLLALGLGAAAVQFAGGTLINSGGFVLPI
ncbi:hypothetical protein [Halosegnis longus]